MDNSWADRITDLEARGWSLTGIGEAIGLSPQGVSDIKQRRTKAPTGMAAVQLHHLHATEAKPPGRRTTAANDGGAASADGTPTPLKDAA